MPSAASWTGNPSIKGSSESMRMALLTFNLIGLQFTWGFEMTYCTPYLLSLGLTKSKTSLVWIAGPLSGMIMQPVIGVLADNSRSKWGRRRPFMLGGAILTAMCLFILGWTAEIVGIFVSDPEMAKPYTVALAVISIYAVDFSINSTQSSGRSLIVDTLPIAKQQLGSAWASRMTALGSLVGYAVGTINLMAVFGHTIGDTQFKQLTFIAATFFVFSVAVTCWAVEERVLITRKDGDARGSAVKLLANILKTTLNLPDRIQAICWVQFWAWIGWFPFLFYSATWVGEVYFRYHPEAAEKASADALGDVGRIGSLALVVFSIITFLSSVGLPWLIRSPDSTTEKRSFTPRPPQSLRPFMSPLITLLKKAKPDLQTAWQYSHLIFAGTMCLAPFVRSLRMATIIVSLCGVPWMLACWAPFSLIGVEINRLTAPASNGATPSYRRLSNPNGDESLRLNHLDGGIPLPDRGDTGDADSDDEKDIENFLHNPNATTGETAGIYLGILNLFSTLPQFVGTFISMIVFSILEPGKSPELHGEKTPEDIQNVMEKPNGIAVCLFIGALSALGAAYATRSLRRRC